MAGARMVKRSAKTRRQEQATSQPNSKQWFVFALFIHQALAENNNVIFIRSGENEINFDFCSGMHREREAMESTHRELCVQFTLVLMQGSNSVEWENWVNGKNTQDKKITHRNLSSIQQLSTLAEIHRAKNWLKKAFLGSQTSSAPPNSLHHPPKMN